MILSDREIRAAVDHNQIGITPLPPPGDRRWASTALDLTLDGELTRWRRPAGGAVVDIDPGGPGFDLATVEAEYAQRIAIPADGYVIRGNPEDPNDLRNFFLGWTAERIALPHTSRIAARVEGKSSLARLGVGVHITAPTIHAGFGSAPDGRLIGRPIRL